MILSSWQNEKLGYGWNGMKKKVLFAATVVKTHIMEFHIPYLKMFQDMGWETAVAARNDYENPADCVIPHCDAYYDIPFERLPWKAGNLSAYRQLKKVIKNGDYDIVHCNTPVAGILSRLACRKLRKQGKIKVLYQAHGLHFFKGGSKSGWLIWYPIEKFFSRFADMMVLINKMDYELVQEKFHTPMVRRVPGIGVNLSQFQELGHGDLRQELGLEADTPIVLSVGELNENKNHKVMIEALSKMKNQRVHYCIAGNGPLLQLLTDFAEEKGVKDRVHFLGYRRDVPVLLRQAEVFVLPSRREGLGMAAIEAMACGLPLVSSNRHGINDYSIENVTGFKYDPADSTGFAIGVEKLIEDEKLRKELGANCKEIAKEFSLESSLACMEQYYQELLN